MPFLLVAIIVAFVIVAAIISHMHTLQRRQELAAWAAARGLQFNFGRDLSIDSRFPEFGCFQAGRDRYGYNMIWGEVTGREFNAFDYHYVTGSGKNRQTHVFSAVIVASPIPLRPLMIRPENFFDKVAEFFGAGDINFESAEFSRRFCVKSPDRKWAYDVLHAQTIEFLLSAPEFRVEFGVFRVLAYRGRALSPADLENASAVALGILERLPQYLVEQQMGQSSC